MDKTFKALLVEEDNGTYTNKVVERSIDDLPDGDLLVKVSYSSLNYKDALSASGNPGVTRNFPHTPGIDAVGEVSQSSSSNFKEGDKVIVTGYDLGMNTAGGFSEFIRIPSSWAIQLPNNLSELDSMCLGTAGLTAGLSIYALDSFRGISDTKSIVTGSTGGVGSISVMLLSKLGSEVTALSGKTDKEDLLKELGAKEVISREQLSELTRLPIGKPLWDLGIDVVSGEILSLLLASLTPGGAIACSGLVGGPSFESSIFPFILRGNTLIGIDSVEIPLEQKENIWKLFANEWSLSLQDTTKIVSLEGISSEIETILKGEQVGRVVLEI